VRVIIAGGTGLVAELALPSVIIRAWTYQATIETTLSWASPAG
jgi:hypothetical protein